MHEVIVQKCNYTGTGYGKTGVKLLETPQKLVSMVNNDVSYIRNSEFISV